MAFAPPPLHAATDGLTLAESERIAIERDAMLREMHAQGAAMRERAVMDGELMDPNCASAPSTCRSIRSASPTRT